MRHLYYTLQTLLRGRGSNIIKVISPFCTYCFRVEF